ncbi:MAG: glycerol-3-phosphate cytidylyltransferase [Clostridia bacterium]|nr:glycerol-3-phosphate cytidylyltransferase [Clostridia bacterium]
MTQTIGVLGAGTWGMALARMLAVQGHRVTVWSALPHEVDQLAAERVHPNLPDMVIPADIIFTKNIEEVCRGQAVLVFAVPSPYVRATAAAARPFIPDGQIIVDVAKGIEADTLYTMTEVIRDELQRDGGCRNVKLVALSGPTHAEEVARDLPTTIVSAATDLSVAQTVQSLFMNTCMRVYTNVDILGVELCGAVKNILALAAGISVGLGYGDNAKAAIITRGMAELTRLGLAMGCMEQTFSGLAGMGDLIVTATSRHSRNNRCGQLIGSGVRPADAIAAVGMVVEGIHAIPAALKLARRYGVEMPIVEAVDSVVSGGADPAEAVRELMSRGAKDELTTTPYDVNFENNHLCDGRRNGMKRVITYGTFDLLHYGHINLLRRARALGDYLVVALSTDEFNRDEKNKTCYFTYEQRKMLLEAMRYVDLVIPESDWDQKRRDVHEYHIDTFVMGDDWKGKFDFLKEEGVEVVYLPRTPEVSTTEIKQDLAK